MKSFTIAVLLIWCLINQRIFCTSKAARANWAQVDGRHEEGYIIDFGADLPQVARVHDQKAVVTGQVLDAVDLMPTGLTYTITIELNGGPVGGDLIDLPPRAGRGPTTFASRREPQIVTEADGRHVLAIRLLGLLGDRTLGDDGRGLSFYRDPSSMARVSLTLGERYHLANVRYTLTDIDMVLGASVEETCDEPAEPNNYRCGGSYIDQVTVLRSSERITYQPSAADRITIVDDVISPYFPDENANGYPDAPIEGRPSVNSNANRNADNVLVFHQGEIGSTLQFELRDAGKGLDGDPDGYHDFDAAQQGIGLASGITFDLVEAPPPSTPTPDPNLTSITGRVAYGLADVSARTDLPATEIQLYALGPDVQERLILTTTVNGAGAAVGQYRFIDVRAGEPYRVEARIVQPTAPGGAELNALRLLRTITPTVAEPNRADFYIRSGVLAADASADLLLPDLTPLRAFPLPEAMSDLGREEVMRDYPGLAEWYVDSESQPGRVLLRFGTLAANVGRGPLHIIGGKAVASQNGAGIRPIYQRIYTPDGAYIDRRAGLFVFHPEHEHVHMAAFEQYNLRTLDDEQLVAASSKVSFCLTDVLWPVAPQAAADANVATVPLGWSCGADEQSINVGFSDYYGPGLADQWIDVTHVSSGSYWLEVVVDPLNRLQESNEANNKVRVRINFEQPLE